MIESEVTFIKVDGMVAAFAPDRPGAHSPRRTLAEARRNIAAAIALILAANRRRVME